MTIVKVKAKKVDRLTSLLAQEEASGFSDMLDPTDSIREMVYNDEKRLRDFGFSDTVVGRAKNVAEMADDDDPMFVVVRTEEGESRSGREYDGSILESIAEQINAKEPVAHLGHIPDHQLDTALPDPQTKWLGAVTRMEGSRLPERMGKMVKTIYVAGYCLKGAKIRDYIKTGVVDSTSWQGRAAQKAVAGRVKVERFVLDSLDWSRKGAQGMPTASVVALAREMTKEGSTKMDGDGKSLAEVTPDEFKEANPNGYALLVREISGEKDGTIREMQEKVDAADEDKNLLAAIRQALKLDENANPLEKIAAMVESLGVKAQEIVSSTVGEVLKEKVRDEDKRRLVAGLIAKYEPAMEMAAGEKKTKDEAEGVVREMVEGYFNDDALVKEQVSEMAPPLPRRHEDVRGGNRVDFESLGMKRETRKVGV